MLQTIEKLNIPYILDGIHHYWFKGYIPNESLFNFINRLILKNQDPFQEDEFLKIMVINGIYQMKALQRGFDENYYFNGYTIDKEKIDQIWQNEYQRLQKAIGKTKYNDKCGNCGNKIISKVKIVTQEDIPDPYYQDCLGKVCWIRKCTCKSNDQAIIEIDHGRS